MQLKRYHKMPPHVRVMVIGNQPTILKNKRDTMVFHPDSWNYARNWASKLGAQPDCIYTLRAAAGATSAGFRKIISQDNVHEARWYPADGMILNRPGSAMVYQTKDCPTLVVYNTNNHQVGVVHCGRPATTPCDGENIITRLIWMMAQGNSIDHYRFYITGGIAGKHFTHNQTPERRRLAQPFLYEYGPDTFDSVEELGLDLPSAIRKVCIDQGANPAHIIHDGIDTFSHTGLASHCRTTQTQTDDHLANTVIVTAR